MVGFIERLSCVLMASCLLSGITGCLDGNLQSKHSLNTARNYFEKGAYDRAAEMVNKVLSQDSQNSEATFLHGQLALIRKDPATALNSFIRTLALAPDHQAAMLAIAGLYLSNGQYDQARPHIEHAFQNDPQDKDALLLKVRLLFAEKQPQQAENLLLEMKAAGTATAEVYLLLASAKAQQGDSSGAESQLREGIEKNPENITLRLSLVRLFAKSKQPEKAIAALKDVIAKVPDNPKYPLMLAAVYWDDGQKQRAEETLENLIQWKNGSVDIVLSVADFYFKRRLLDKAESILVAAIEKQPVDSRLVIAKSRLDGHGGNENRAVETLLAFLKDDAPPAGKERAAVHLALAQNYFQLKQNDPAARYIAKVLEGDPDNLDAIYLKGKIDLSRGSFDQAVSAFKAVVSRRPDLEEGYLKLANAYLLTGQSQNATTVLKQGLQILPSSKILYLTLARTCSLSKDYKGAEAAMIKALKIDPADFKVQAELGDFYIALKDYRQAEREYAEIITKYPDRSFGYLKLSRLYRQRNRTADAIAELEKGYTITHQSDEMIGELASVYLSTGNNDAALNLCEDRIARRPDDAMAYHVRGQIHTHLKQYKEAEQAFRKAVALAPKWVAPGNRLAALLIDQNRTAEAMEQLTSGLKQNPKNPSAYLTLARISENAGDLKKAAGYYEQGLANVSDFGLAANRLALLLCQSDRKEDVLDRALQLALLANQLNPGSVEVLDTLAWVYNCRGENQRARQLLEIVAAQAPENPLVNYHLGMVLLNGGEKKKAHQHLETALKSKDPFLGRSLAERALATLKGARPS